jgi:fructose-1,6-bisphosphatase II
VTRRDVSFDLSLELLKVVEQAAVACAQTMGQGDRTGSDKAAVEAMRRTLDDVPIDGTIVIGEGERDEAPMLFIGEKVGQAAHGQTGLPAVDIAVDPLEGTNLCATGAPNAIAVLAASTKGGLLHAPDLYMEKLVVGPRARHTVSLDRPVRSNLKAIAKALERKVEDLVVMVLDRPRHEKLISDIRAAGARIRLIGDGDLSAGIAAALEGSGVHAVMGTGGAPEDLCAARDLEARTRGTQPRDGHHRLQAHLFRDGSGVGRFDHLRRHGRDRRRAHEGRAVFRPRHPHQLGGHAERAAPDSVHRHHSRPSHG